MIYTFDEFDLDTGLFELRRNGQACPIEPQVFNVLRYLIEHADHVVSKDELLEKLWPGRIVSESALTSRIKTARRLIGDSGSAQRLIRTVHGRGYRFVGTVRAHQAADGDGPVSRRAMGEGDDHARAPAESAPAPGTAPAGRGPELAALIRAWRAAQAGELRLVFVEGEAGIGKTTLLEVFIDSARGEGFAAVGQCVELGAAGEAYMPVLDALHGLCRGAGAEAVRACLESQAPSWLLQLPGLLSGDERAALEAQVLGITQERMLRELAAFAGALAAKQPLVLVLEDLHWSDPSTLALLAWLARRREPMRVLIVGTLRPARSGSARQLSELVYDLRLRGLAQHLLLRELDSDAVAAYVQRRLGSQPLDAGLIDALRRRTEGNPLFLVSVIDGLLERDLLRQGGTGWTLDATAETLFGVIPDNLRLLIEHQLSQLDEHDRDLLGAASVAGARFSAALVEAMLETDGEDCERRLVALADSSPFIVRDGETRWPDGTSASQFRFRHMLYLETIHAELPARLLRRLHARAGTRLEAAFGTAAAAHAVELAVHFSAAEETAKAVDYRIQAAQQAFGRAGYPEVIGHLDSSLDLIEQHPGLPGRDAHELSAQLLLALALIQTNGWSDARAERALERARDIAEQQGDRRLPTTLYLLAAVHELRGEYAESQRLLEQQQALPRAFETALAELESHELLACSLYHQGKFEAALEHARAGLAAAAKDLDSKLYAYGENPRVSCHNWAGLALWFLGFPEQAQTTIDDGLALARNPARRYSLSNALCQAASLHQLRREPERVLAFADEAIAVALDEGFRYPLAVARILKGWAITILGRPDTGVGLIREGLDGHRASGARMDRPYYLGLLAEALAAQGQWAEAGAALDESLTAIDERRRFFQEAELLRLKARVALDGPAGDERRARELLEASRAAAIDQKNRIAQLRAETDLAHLADNAGERRRAAAALSATLGSFSEGHDAPDLRLAAAMLD